MCQKCVKYILVFSPKCNSTNSFRIDAVSCVVIYPGFYINPNEKCGRVDKSEKMTVNIEEDTAICWGQLLLQVGTLLSCVGKTF